MPVLRFGSSGWPLIYVPSSDGDETEFERYGFHQASAPWIEAGRVQFFCIDGCGRTTLFEEGLEPPQRIRRYARFEQYASGELLDWVCAAAESDTVGIVGSSYGAFVAANLLFKHCPRVRMACGLGGVYEMWHRLDGFHDDDVYSHTPLEYLPRLSDPSILGAIRATRGIVMFGAGADPWLPQTHQLRAVLKRKQLPHTVEIWPAPADHHERWWKGQLHRFLEHYL